MSRRAVPPGPARKATPSPSRNAREGDNDSPARRAKGVTFGPVTTKIIPSRADLAAAEASASSTPKKGKGKAAAASAAAAQWDDEGAYYDDDDPSLYNEYGEYIGDDLEGDWDGYDDPYAGGAVSKGVGKVRGGSRRWWVALQPRAPCSTEPPMPPVAHELFVCVCTGGCMQ
jgi:hypothetical protein